MKKAFINSDIISLFDPTIKTLKVSNKKSISFITFIDSFYIITVDDSDNVNCSLTFYYLKHNINLNLFYPTQIDLFLSSCSEYFDINMQFSNSPSTFTKYSHSIKCFFFLFFLSKNLIFYVFK
jgi:hypothetical protein